MPLVVVSFATYLTIPPALWRDDDSVAYKFVQAIKRKPFKGYGFVPVNGVRMRLGEENAADAVRWFATMASTVINLPAFSKPPLFVPVPNSDCAVNNKQIPRTVYQAQELSTRIAGTSVLDCLRWKQAMPSASKAGGTRDPQQLYDNLALTTSLPNESECILIDDVKTSGGHLQAARAVLLESGGKCPLAICAARTVKAKLPNVFGADTGEVNDWRPAPTLY